MNIAIICCRKIYKGIIPHNAFHAEDNPTRGEPLLYVSEYYDNR